MVLLGSQMQQRCILHVQLSYLLAAVQAWCRLQCCVINGSTLGKRGCEQGV